MIDALAPHLIPIYTTASEIDADPEFDKFCQILADSCHPELPPPSPEP